MKKKQKACNSYLHFIFYVLFNYDAGSLMLVFQTTFLTEGRERYSDAVLSVLPHLR